MLIYLDIVNCDGDIRTCTIQVFSSFRCRMDIPPMICISGPSSTKNYKEKEKVIIESPSLKGLSLVPPLGKEVES